MRQVISLLATILLVSTCVTAEEPAPDLGKPWISPAARQWILNERLYRARTAEHITFEVADVPRRDAVAQLSKVMKVPISVNWGSLRHIPPDQIVTFKATDYAGSTVASLLLRQPAVIWTDGEGLHVSDDLMFPESAFDEKTLDHAFLALLRTRVFLGKALGPTGDRPPQWDAYEFLRKHRQATDIFRDLLKHGAPGGKSYALLALRKLAPKEYEAAVEELRDNEETLVSWTGGCVSFSTTLGENFISIEIMSRFE